MSKDPFGAVEKFYDKHPKTVIFLCVVLAVLIGIVNKAAWDQMSDIERAAWILANGSGR